jgi:plastocyanin
MYERSRYLTALAALAIVAIVALSCTSQPGVPTTTDSTTVQQQTIPSAPAPGAANPLAKDFATRLGITVSPLTPATGKPLLSPKPGDLYFFSNSSTTWGATQTKNSVWVIDAKTKQTVLEVAPPDGAGYSSHGIAVSSDGKYVYLAMIGPDNHTDVLDGRTFEVVQTIRTISRPHHWKLWRDAGRNKDLIIGEDFNSSGGSGFYVLDPSEGNAVVGGLSRGDFPGNPYVSAGSPDGKSIVVTLPAPGGLGTKGVNGILAKVDPKTWTVSGMVGIGGALYPLVTNDGKYAYVTSGAEGRLYKVNLETMTTESFVATGPGPWGQAISYDQTKVYTADKGEGPGYNQQGRTSTVVDLGTMGVTNVLSIGITTDHALISPDGSEIWFTSNAEHNIYVYDAKTETLKTIIKDPADGDVHGGAWVLYKADGKGGVIGEVVADYAGLHGSALKAQTEYLSQPAVAIALNGSGFVSRSVNLTAGKTYRITVKNTAGTSAGKITFESKDLGISNVSLQAGESQEFTFTAPKDAKDLSATTNKTPNGALTLKVAAAVAAAPAQAPAATTTREIKITTVHFLFDVRTVEIKPGETVKFTVVNTDEEKHNLVGLGNSGLLSPDFSGGSTGSYVWTAPTTPQTIKVMCAYHPQAVFDIVIK